MPTKRKSTIEVGINSDDDLKKVIGGRIKRIRKRFDKSASWVAERIGITRGALTQIENGRNNISATMLWKIASIFKCDIKDFFPAVPDSAPLTQADLNVIASEDTQAAEFAKRAFKPKKS
jgi:transcriptional regulator with XRE-family HTH domain